MSEIDRDRLKDLFADALELHPEERIAFVYNTCVGESKLIDELLSLLAAHDAADNLIEQNLLDIPGQIAPESSDLTDRKFGNYRIIREIGHGGMGTVFLATRADGEFDQQVALKIVRQSIADSHLTESFRRERQILAGLQHPNIAMLLDGGLSEIGEPFIAMEYIDGLPLNEYASENNLGVSERLGLFLKVCSAVAYAHRNLVVHRDLKPSNIIVTPGGEPKLLDFGLARAFQGDLENTQTAIRAFTPAYASPEQISGRSITTASDVYSLGVVLYELLTGSKPLQTENKDFEEVIQTVTKTEPLPPSSVTIGPESRSSIGQLRGDLDNIVLMALRKEPERRYSSVEDLAADIQNYQAARPVSARPNTLGYRAGKFVRRNKVAVGAAVLITLTLLGGIVASLWQAREARRERDRAEKRFQDVRKLSNSLLFEITPQIENLPGATSAREAVVTRALEYLDSLATETATDIGLMTELAAAYEKVGDLQGNPDRPNLNNYSGAVQSYEKALQIRRSLPQSDENRRLIAKNLQNSSLIRNRQNDITGSIRDGEAAIALYDELVAAFPGQTDLSLARIEAQIDHAQIYSRNNQYGVAVPIFRSAQASLTQLDQASLDVKKLLTRTTAYLGNALSWDGQQAEAEVEIGKAVDAIQDMTWRDPNNVSLQFLAWNVYGFASSIYEDTDNETSRRFAEKELDAAKRSVEADKADVQARYNLARAYSRVGIMFGKVGRQNEASPMLHRSEDMYNALIADDPRNDGYRRDLGNLYVRMGDTSEKAANLQDALLKYQNSAVIFERLAAADSKNALAKRDLAQSLKSVGLTAQKLGQIQNARLSLERALALLNELRSQDSLGKYDEKMIGEIEAALAGLGPA